MGNNVLNYLRVCLSSKVSMVAGLLPRVTNKL